MCTNYKKISTILVNSLQNMKDMGCKLSELSNSIKTDVSIPEVQYVEYYKNTFNSSNTIVIHGDNTIILTEVQHVPYIYVSDLFLINQSGVLVNGTLLKFPYDDDRLFLAALSDLPDIYQIIELFVENKELSDLIAELI